MNLRSLILIWLLALSILAAQAKEATPLVQDEATEQRLIAITSELRCLVCQNESLAASRADLANDLRREIRVQIQQGKTNEEIMAFVVSRYGDFVRYRPPLKASTVLLWFGPGLLLFGGLGGLIHYLRRRNRMIGERPLNKDELRRAEQLLNGKQEGL